MSKRIGPSMSTEPGWMTAVGACPFLLGDHSRRRSQNDPSMLLSFERPASAGDRVDTSDMTRPQCARPAGVTRFSTVLENCTEATSAAIDKRRLKTGITGPSVTLNDHVGPDHRQDSKGTRWMPWHQESMKGVNGCDKPRLGAE